MDWSTVLKMISEKISKPSFETWLAGTEAEINDDVIIVKAKNEFQADWLESRYKTLIFETVREVAGQTYDIEFMSNEKPLKINSMPSEKYVETGYVELKSLTRDNMDAISKLAGLLKTQEDKIEALQKRIEVLEKSK